MQAVPPFEQYYFGERGMSQEQLRFFRNWEHAWERGIATDVEGNISYLLCYVYKVMNRPGGVLDTPNLTQPPVTEAIPELQRLIEEYGAEDRFRLICGLWLSDCYVILEDFHRAIDVYPLLSVTSRNTYVTDGLLSLKVHAGVRVSGRDILTLHGPKVTKWGRQHLDQVERYLDIIVSAFEKNQEVNLLEQWKGSSQQVGYSGLRGMYIPSGAEVPGYSFSRNPEVIEFTAEKVRDAENTAREEMGLPGVGEGWVAETQLYYELCRAFSSTEVIHHARPAWLGKQHLDVFIPEYEVAIEYQGTQHDQPVEYFGGLEAFHATRKRDQTKMHLCDVNSVHLIYVREGYDLAEVIREVVAEKRSGCWRDAISAFEASDSDSEETGKD